MANNEIDLARQLISVRAESGYTDMNLEGFDRQLSFLLALDDGFNCAMGTVFWNRAFRGFSKACLDKARKYWLHFLMPSLRRSDGIYDCSHLNIHAEIAPIFEENGFKLKFHPNGTIVAILWDDPEPGTLAEELLSKSWDQQEPGTEN